MDPPELPEEILRKENQLNQLIDSIEPDVMFARHLESQIIQVARGQQAWQKSSPPQGAWLRSFLISIGKWGLTFVGLGILVMVLVYGIDHLIPPLQLPEGDQEGSALPASTGIPTSQPTASATTSLTPDTPFPTSSGKSQVIIIEEDNLTSVPLRTCPSVTCAVVGEISAGQQAQAVGMVSDGSWIQVEYDGTPEGKAWVYGKLVQVSGDPPEIVLLLPSPTPVVLPAIAPQACIPSGLIKPLLGYLPEHPAHLIGGVYEQSGDFIFEILLGCDPLFGPEAEFSNHYSSIPGLGLHLVLSYRGSTEQGEILEAWGVRVAGMESVNDGEGSSTSGMISSSIGAHLTGLSIPSELLPSLSQPGEYPLEFVYQARNPQGIWTGVILTFTLINTPDGFYLTDFKLKPLSTPVRAPGFNFNPS